MCWLVCGAPLVPNSMIGSHHKYIAYIGVLACHYSFHVACKMGPGVITEETVECFAHEQYDGVLYHEGYVCRTCDTAKVTRDSLPHSHSSTPSPPLPYSHSTTPFLTPPLHHPPLPSSTPPTTPIFLAATAIEALQHLQPLCASVRSPLYVAQSVRWGAQLSIFLSVSADAHRVLCVRCVCDRVAAARSGESGREERGRERGRVLGCMILH